MPLFYGTDSIIFFFYNLKFIVNISEYNIINFKNYSFLLPYVVVEPVTGISFFF